MNTQIFVSKFYEMNPEFEDLIAEGSELRDGMIVLIEDSMNRADPDHVTNEYDSERLRENNRWCTVSLLKVRQRFEYDQYGVVMGEGSPLISFVAEYADGTKKKRTYDSSYAWIVKKDSL